VSDVVVCDVGPRDGLQNEDVILEPVVRAELVDRLGRAGLPRIEAASFVNPDRVPQMAGAEEVIAAVEPTDGVVHAGLVLNERGYERLRTSGLTEVHYSFGATESFNRRNQNASVEASIATARRIIERARGDECRVTVTIGVAFGCPFEGAVAAAQVLDIAHRMAGAGADEVAFADTIGVGVPDQVDQLVGAAQGFGVPIGVHFHNTRGTGIANSYAAIEAGATVFDASVGGTGGCPFAPRATGNIATEDLVYLLHGQGIDTGIDLDALIGVAEWLGQRLHKALPGMVSKAGGFEAVAG
jgi:isopropylmalate/homocitrate/citramalate synthase